MKATPAKAAGPAWALMSALIAVTALCIFMPINPGMPAVGLDASWQTGMNQAVGQGLVIGRDLIFTFGPYAGVFTRIFHPATDGLVMLAGGVLALSYGLACALLMRQASFWRQALLLAGTVALAYSPDAPILAYPLIAGVAAHRLVVDEDRDGWIARADPLLLALLFFAFGLLPLVKGSALAPCGAVTGLVALDRLLAGRFASALASVESPLAAAALFWILAGQPIGALPAYVQSLGPIISGYTEAMAFDGSVRELQAYVVAAFVVLLVVAAQNRARPRHGLVLVLMFAATLFLAFKGGFIRHDAHAIFPAVVLVLTGLTAAGIGPGRRAAAVCALPVIVGLLILSHYTPLNLANAKALYIGAKQGLERRRAPGGLAEEYGRALADLGRSSPLPRLPGSSDTYPFEQAALIASGNRWNPRPVLQSYSAYTPSLADDDRRHLEGPTAPDNIFFRVETIDDRMPSMDDGSSWPLLLSRYRVTGMAGDALILRRHPGEVAQTATPLASASHRFGDQVRVPDAAGPVFVKIDIRPSLLGRLANLALKTTPVQITLSLQGGGTVKRRLVSGMVKTGFVLSPVVASTEDMLLLYGDPSYLDSRRVSAVSIDAPRGHRLWSPTYRIEFLALAAPRDPSLKPLFGFVAPITPAAGTAIAAAAHCDGAIDLIDGASPAPPKVTASKQLQARGWLSPSTDRGEVADRTLVVLTDSAGRHTFYPAKTQPRPDVAAVFKRPSLADSGFSVDADVTGLSGAYTLGLAYEKAGGIGICPQFNTPTILH